MSLALSGKCALVTGVTSGIGNATTRRLLDQGARVIGLGRDPDKLERVRSEFGTNFEPLVCDLGDAAARASALRSLAEHRIDVLVNNAAECVYEDVLGLSADRLERLFSVNVVAAIELAQAVARRMSKGGHIVQLSSVTARHIANARFAAYATTKVAVEALTSALRMELHPRGIAVSTVLPGLVDTPIYDKVEGFAPALDKLKQHVPEWLSADDIADVIAWILTRPPNVAVSEVVVLPRAQAR